MSLIVDGLVISKWDRKVFEDMRAGGLVAANCTCSIWEDMPATMRNIATWKAMFRDNADLISQVYNVEDIEIAHSQGKVGVYLGWQNSTGFGDYLPFVEVFHALGIRVVQLTYNTANMAGFGCYESNDGGLTDFGRELVHEMNRVGILVDLSHVGARTAHDVIVTAKRPVAYTHCCPSAMFAHPRNKSDEDLRFIADHGGFVGVAGVPSFLRRKMESTVDDYVDAILHVIDVIGEDRVGLGTDITQGHGQDFFDWIASDKGYGRTLVDMGGIPVLGGLATLRDYGNLVAAMEKRIKPATMDKVLGKNWMSFLREVWV
ncbi:MAG: membrane dipeptidase [Variibacter sp.]